MLIVALSCGPTMCWAPGSSMDLRILYCLLLITALGGGATVISIYSWGYQVTQEDTSTKWWNQDLNLGPSDSIV